MESEAEGSEITDSPVDISTFPECIILEILSRLPVKSLLKFRCVCKSWCSLISTKHFIKTHLENSEKNTTFSNHRVILMKKHFWGIERYSLPSLLPEQDAYSYHFDGEMDNPKKLFFFSKHKGIRVVGSCNGLICALIETKYFYLLNPATKESKRLPDFHPGMKHVEQCCISKYGFGFDESSDDYKVYAVFSAIMFESGTKFRSIYHLIAKVYSLKSDSWKRIEVVSDDSLLDPEGKFASGKLHWSRNPGLNARWDIVSFDLKNELSGIVEQPSCVDADFYATLGVLDGCLCVLCDYCESHRLDVWIWNQYGEQDSWRKMVSFSYLPDPLEVPFPTPLCILPNGEVLFIHESSFLSYHPKKNWSGYLHIFDSDHEFVGAEVYVESLVSLVRDGVSNGGEPSDGVSKRGKSRKNGRRRKI